MSYLHCLDVVGEHARMSSLMMGMTCFSVCTFTYLFG